MDSTLQTLGQSLGHWQAVYIVSIVAAVLSTFAIVVFAFHIKEHKFGLKVSNYVYVVFSLLAVLATIVILNKSHSLDTEKDRIAGLKITQAQIDAAQAKEKAETARGNAEEARSKAETARQKAETIQAKAEEARQNSLKAVAEAQSAVIDKEKILHDNLQLQKQVEDERMARVQIEQRLAPRNVSGAAQQQMITKLRPILPQTVDFVLYPGNPESDNLAKQIAWVFQQVNWQFHFAQPMGGSVQGVKIEYDGKDSSVIKAVEAIKEALTISGIQITAIVPTISPISDELGVFSSDGKVGNGQIRIFVGSK